MTSVNNPGYYALLHANGMSFNDVLKLHAHDLAEHIRSNHHTKDGKSCSSLRCHGGKAAKLIDPEE